jgi:hypothetical protein
MRSISCRYPAEEGTPAALASPAYRFAQIISEQDGIPLSSLSLYDNPRISYRGEPTMLFGDLNFTSGEEAAALMQKASEVAGKAGKAFLLGPMNGSTWQEYRVPLQGDAPLFSGDLGTPALLGTWLQQAGFGQAETYRSSVSGIHKGPKPRIPEGICIRTITPGSLASDLKILYPLCMRAFALAPYFTPVTEQLFARQYESARPLLQDGLSYIALHEGRGAAFIFAYADTLRTDLKTAVIKTIARDPESGVPGLITSMADTLYQAAWENGYRSVVHAFMHDNNRSVQRSQEFGGTILRSYALYAKSLRHGK